MRESDAPSSALQRDKTLAWALLSIIGALFVAYCAVSLPRLTNVHFGDVEFTGWSGPMGSRLLRGDRPYIDFVLPIPPGSFVVLAAIEKIVGRPLLLEELWLNAALHLSMGFLAYRMARPFTCRKNAVLTALSTLVVIIQLNKECAYDHTAQFVAWASVAVGISALMADDPARSRTLWLFTGTLSSFTLAFKQSTGIGAIFGWLLAILYVAGVELWSGHRERARSWLVPLLRYCQGAALGLGGLWLMLLLLGSTARAYFQAVFTDASILKGGTKFLIQNLTVYLFDYPAYPASLLVIAVWVLIGFRLQNQRGSLHVGDEAARCSPLRGAQAGVIGLLSFGTFGSAIWFLRKAPYPISWVLDIDKLKAAPALGLVPTTALFVAHVVRTREVSPEGGLRADPQRAGHAMNAAMIAAFACSLMHNTSAPEFRPYYDNNAIIPFTFMMTFVVLDRAKLEWLGAVFLALVLGSMFGNKYYRTMRATTKMDAGMHWAGMRASAGGVEIARAATRARELTAPSDTVLVLPEDVQLTALIGRPRPGLLGAIVFVDQYAPRLAVNDIARLDEHLPKVIVIHPRRVTSWQRFFRIWSGQSGAEAVIQHVLDLLPKRYRRDSTYGTTFLFEPSALDLYVRNDGPQETDKRTEQDESADTEPSEEPRREPAAPEKPAE